MQYLSLGEHYDGVRLSINNFLKPKWLTEAFNREMDRVVNPRGDVSKNIAMHRVQEIRAQDPRIQQIYATKAKIDETLASMDRSIAGINATIAKMNNTVERM